MNQLRKITLFKRGYKFYQDVQIVRHAVETIQTMKHFCGIYEATKLLIKIINIKYYASKHSLENQSACTE